METKNQVPLRSQVAITDTWDLTTIFANEDEFESAFTNVETQLGEVDQYRGTLANSADALFAAIAFEESVFETMEKLYTYAHLCFDTDTSDARAQERQSRCLNLYTKVASAFSFYRTELMAADEAVILGYLEEDPRLRIYAHDFAQLFAKRPHILSEEAEKLLADATEALNTPSETFGMLNNTDIEFPEVLDEDGTMIQLSHARYGRLMESRDRKVREAAFRGMYATYKKLIHTFATTLSGQVKANNFLALSRKYPSARAAALDRNSIPETVYDALVSAVHEGLPVLHRYLEIRRKALGVDQLTMYDLHCPVVEEVDLSFTYEQAQEMALKALAPLGDDYQQLLRRAFAERWIDVVENKGKRSGAYSSGCYGTNPFILLNWQDTLDQVFTLVHELGHSMHSYYTRAHQPYVYGDYSIFVAEVASTTNENLLTDYLLREYKDQPKITAYVLNHYLDGFRGTVYRQTQFAEFEHWIHVSQQNNQPLSADVLTKKYFELNKRYYGDQLFYDEEIGYEWSRIPHFYYDYYVYQYATGFSAASALAQRILTGGPEAVDAYKDYLKAGCSDYPIDVLKKAGVDMRTNQPTIEAIEVFRKRVDQLADLLSA